MTSAQTGISKRVLIADDDALIRRRLNSSVTSQGYVAVEVSDGREAYKLLQSDADFQAAILDMNMPYLNGVELTRYMRTERRLQRIRVLLITAEQNLRLMADGFSAGATAFLPKTFTPEQLQSTLRLVVSNGSRFAA